jgi:sensor domain CHASE-containing protein
MVGMLVALLVSTLGIWMAINAIIAPTYSDLETQDAKKAAAVALETYRDISRNLGDRTADWALWDDCYQFMKDRNKSFIESNLNPESFKSAKVDFIFFIGSDGKPVHLFSVEPLAVANIAQGLEFPWPLHKDSSLRNTGFLAFGGQAYSVAVSQIHNSGGSAPS